ncbi:MAG: hypothetical protein LW720_14890 [Pirellula sp.]|jgi:hypothetical protein|nr:hypothetical protein [Pirellula sp.]
MPKITMLFGALLCGISLAILMITQKVGSPSIFIPMAVGLPLLILGLLSNINPHLRKHFMHAAVALGLLGALAALVPSLMQLGKLAQGQEIELTRAGSVWAMAILCFTYVAMGVQSFIRARKSASAKETA